MRLVLATTNSGKIDEIKRLYKEFEVVAFTELLDIGEIVENGKTFAQNAMIKANAVYSALEDKRAIVLSDDSGISVDVLDGAPGIYSARYARVGADDQENLQKLIDELKIANATSSLAHYTAAISIVSHNCSYTMHGWMHGRVIDEVIGDRGFGYDPIFIPNGYNKTLGELDDEVKQSISHRSKALKIAKSVLSTIKNH